MKKLGDRAAKEWPMMIGGLSSPPIMAVTWSMIAGTVWLAMTSGFSRSASTSISKPGYAGARTW